MAQRVTVALEDDLNGGPADETVRFGVGTTEYEIDLNEKNAAKLRARLAPLRRARPQGWERAASPGRADRGEPSAQRRCPRLGRGAGPHDQ